MISLLPLALGLILLLVGGAMLVRGASEIAARLGVSPLVVGLTIVGFGTSAPELAVNITGAMQGATDLAFGNVIGSNITNMGLVLGAAALMTPIAIQGQVVRREIPLLLLATTVITVMSLDGLLEGKASVIGRSDAIVLLLLFMIFIYVNVLDMARRPGPDALAVEIEKTPLVKAQPNARLPWLLVVAGIVLLYFGGEMTVSHGSTLAQRLGISATIVGLFVVAIGTSLPELATSAIAAARSESDLALGNVVGSNIFNSFVVLSAGALITPITVPQGGIGDIVLSWCLAALLIPIFIFGKARMGRKTGLMLLTIYIGYVIVRAVGEKI